MGVDFFGAGPIAHEGVEIVDLLSEVATIRSLTELSARL